MIYKVDHNSPPRYLIQGAEKDKEEEIDYKAMRALRTRALAEAVFNSPSKYTFELTVEFRNVYVKDEIRVQTVKASSFELQDDKIICLFQIAKENPVFFSYNHKARYSTCSLYVTGPFTSDVRNRLSHFAQYVETPDNVEFNIASLDLSLRANLVPPTDVDLQAIKPKTARKLFFENEPSVVDSYERGGQLKMGAICKLATIQVEVPIS